MKTILLCFQAVSGLKINFFKSEVIGVSMPEEHLRDFAGILGCKVGMLPTSYLGLPLCIGTPSKSLWFPVVEKLEKRLASWKANYLSWRGQISLIKSVLSSLPIYYLSLFKCPSEIVRWIEKL